MPKSSHALLRGNVGIFLKKNTKGGTMQNDRAFECSVCGECKYDTELALEVCTSCASKNKVEQQVAHEASPKLPTIEEVLTHIYKTEDGRVAWNKYVAAGFLAWETAVRVSHDFISRQLRASA
jgi:methionyl-tRNA synthetase